MRRLTLLLPLLAPFLLGTTVSQNLDITVTGTATQTSTIFQEFNPWSGTTSPDGIWRLNGVWTGTGGNTLDPANAALTSTYSGETDRGFLLLTTKAGQPLRGAEIQTVTSPGYGYGYYEVRMKTTTVKNAGVVSFFWVEAPNYGSHEWDIEFTMNEPWAGTNNNGDVHLTIHPSEKTFIQSLSFNPSLAFHRYGFLWTPGRIDYTVDGQIAHTFIDSSLNTSAKGYIMMNTWSGNANFGGGPPAQDATSVYDWVKFYANASVVVP